MKRLSSMIIQFSEGRRSEKCGADRYVLVDSSKFHVRPYIDKVMKLEDIHHIITNKDVSEENIKALKDAHIDVLLA